MANVAVVGAQWGDEGKGKLVDWLSERADVVVRFQGGHNAGHTLVIDGVTFKLSLLPSGIVRPGKLSVIGNGVVIDPWALVGEIEKLKGQGVEVTRGNLRIAGNATLILGLHRELDQMREAAAGAGKIGTTGRGIGPTYADLTSRVGIRMQDLAHPAYLKKSLQKLYSHHHIDIDTKELSSLMEEIKKAWQTLKYFVKPIDEILHEARLRDEKILFEGAQGAMLDRTWGSYPFVTSSNTIVDAIGIGSGFSARHLDKVIGIFKSYCTRVGEGPFPTELFDKTGDYIREKGNEFGSTTGRPRRIGYFDAVLAAYAARLNTVDEIALTLLDVLSGVDELKICVGYETGQKVLSRPPSHPLELARVKPVYFTFEGWQEDITGVRAFADLPKNAQLYLKAIEDAVQVPVSIVSVGKDRRETFKIPITG